MPTRARLVMDGAVLDRRRFTVTSAPGVGGFAIGTTKLDSSSSSVVTGPVVCEPVRFT